MKRNLFALLVFVFLLSGCGTNPAGVIPTPTVYEGFPTPTLAYEVIGSTKYTAMVVVDPAINTDRAGLLEIGYYMCNRHDKCKVWFWDDINKADPTYPIDPEKEQYIIAYFNMFFRDWDQNIKMYTLGDPR